MRADLLVLKYDSQALAMQWLSENPGVAVSGENCLGKVCRSKMYFSHLLDTADIAQILEFFPDAIYIDPQTFTHLKDCPHKLYSVPSDRHKITQIFRNSLDATIKTSPCCLEILSPSQTIERIQELQIRLGCNLSQAQISQICHLYNNIYE